MPFLLNLKQKCNEYFSLRPCKVIPSQAVKRSAIKSYCPQKKKSLSCVFDLVYEICRRTVFHIIPHCSKPTAGLMTAVNYKMADLSRGAKKGKKRRGKNGKNTLWLPTIAPASAPAPHRIKHEGGFGQVNHFLQVVNSQGRQNESDVCVHIKWRHHSNALPESLPAFLSHSSSNVEKCWTLKS